MCCMKHRCHFAGKCGSKCGYVCIWNISLFDWEKTGVNALKNKEWTITGVPCLEEYLKALTAIIMK
jgi:hypothetical protein